MLKVSHAYAMAEKVKLHLVTVCLIFAGSIAAFAQEPSPSLTPLQAEINRQTQRLGSDDVEQRRDALMRLGSLRRAEASRASKPALTDPLPIIRATAAGAVVALPPDEATAALVPLLADKDEFVRQQTAYALGLVKSRAAVAPLLERLSLDKMQSVRAAAVVALGEIEDEAAVVPLANLLSISNVSGSRKKRETNEFILRAAAQSLGQIGSRTAVPVLIEIVGDEASAVDVRREAARALGLIGDPNAMPALRAAMTSGDVYLSRIAVEALARINRNQGRVL